MTEQGLLSSTSRLAAQANEIALRLLEELSASGKLPPPPPFLSAVRRTLAIYYQGNFLFLGTELAALLNSVRDGQFVALHAYYEATPEAALLHEQIAAAIHEKTGAEVLFPNSLADLPADATAEPAGVHIQLVASDQPSMGGDAAQPPPAALLRHLRSYADREALLANGRRLLRIDLAHSITGGLTRMLRILGEMAPLADEGKASPGHPLWTWRSPNLPPDL